MRTSNFDRIAPVYDFLATLVFGRSILNSQCVFLQEIKEGARILVLGGGTGKFLYALSQKCPDCEIWFIDASAEMISIAAKRKVSAKVHFLTGTQASIPADIKFDAVITFFFLDLFESSELSKVTAQITTSLKKEAIWLVADFVDENKWWQRRLLKYMYLFFSYAAGMGTKNLPDWRNHLLKGGFIKIKQKNYYSRFIESAVYRS